jgi:hypothetical protein
MAIRTTQNMTPAGTTHYIYDRAGRLLVEATGTGTTQREYVWIDDTPLALFADPRRSSGTCRSEVVIETLEALTKLSNGSGQCFANETSVMDRNKRVRIWANSLIYLDRHR